MAAAVSTVPSRLASRVVPALAIVCAIAAIIIVRSAAAPATYAGISTAASALDLTAGVGLLLAGAIAWVEPRSRRLGLLAMLIALAWFMPDLDGWQGGPIFVRSLGGAATPLFLALVFHLTLAFPLGRLRSRRVFGAVAAVYGLAALVTVGRALAYDPVLDPYCWRNCVENALLVHADPALARRLEAAWLVTAVGVGAAMLALGVIRWYSGSGPARRVLWPVLVPGVVVAATEAGYALALRHTPLEEPSSSQFEYIFYARSLSIVALALGLAWSVLRARRTRSAVSRLASALGEAPPPGKLRAALAHAVGDPTLQVAYWLSGSQRFVDGDGRVTDAPSAAQGRALTPILRDGRQVAVLVHDEALLDGRGLERELGAAALLAVENERLQAEVLAQLEDLRASRNRVVETGDAARRRLERDLHDGAQQRLLALSYDLRLACASAAQDGDTELAALLTTAGDETQSALRELRELAQGIYPAILTEAGLAPALATLADSASLPVELAEVTPERYADIVETATYVTVAEAIGDAAVRGATSVAVHAVRVGERLVVTVEDDGDTRESQLLHLADRVGALGGSLALTPFTLRAEIPCA